MTVPIAEALAQTTKALKAIGWDDEDAGLQAEIMTSAETCGNNQGLVKMYQPELMKPAADKAKPTIERETTCSAVVNGNQSPGMLAAVKAADLAADKCLEAMASGVSPIAMVSAYNTSTSSGQLAFYAERMAKRGVIGIVMANSPEFVAPAKGAKATFGTNPMAFGIPKPGGAALTFDMSTSAVALFGVLTAKAKGEALAEGVAYNKVHICNERAQPSTGPTHARAHLSHFAPPPPSSPPPSHTSLFIYRRRTASTQPMRARCSAAVPSPHLEATRVRVSH